MDQIGSGKTTLLELLLGNLERAERCGGVRRARMPYYNQQRGTSIRIATVLGDDCRGHYTCVKLGRSRACTCEIFFSLRRASPGEALSCERAYRLLLARLFARPFNVWDGRADQRPRHRDMEGSMHGSRRGTAPAGQP